MSMLDCEPPDIDEPSELDNGGVSAPELEVTVLEREREAGSGRQKMDCDLREAKRSSPCAISALSSRLCRSSRPLRAMIMRSSPN